MPHTCSELLDTVPIEWHHLGEDERPYDLRYPLTFFLDFWLKGEVRQRSRQSGAESQKRVRIEKNCACPH